jgi:hypothetical protein
LCCSCTNNQKQKQAELDSIKKEKNLQRFLDRNLGLKIENKEDDQVDISSEMLIHEFGLKDTLDVEFNSREAFKATSIKLQLWKEVEKGERIMYSSDIEISPEHTTITNRIPASKIISAFGDRKYFMALILKDSTIGKAAFILDSNRKRKV